MKTQVTIPVEDNPQHVRNLESITLLEAQGFQGPDASLAESLFEYGLAWRELDKEMLFIYRHPSMEGRFDRCEIDKDTDVQKEWNWVNWDALMGWNWMKLQEWLKMPLPWKLGDLVNHYGTEEIFGSSYWEGFAISED